MEVLMDNSFGIILSGGILIWILLPLTGQTAVSHWSTETMPPRRSRDRKIDVYLVSTERTRSSTNATKVVSIPGACLNPDCTRSERSASVQWTCSWPLANLSWICTGIWGWNWIAVDKNQSTQKRFLQCLSNYWLHFLKGGEILCWKIHWLLWE